MSSYQYYSSTLSNNKAVAGRFSCMRLLRVTVISITSGLLLGCGGGDDEYTLYRNSIVGNLRIHVATFNAAGESEGYNRENCLTAQKLFENQPGILTRFWCEKGGYKK